MIVDANVLCSAVLGRSLPLLIDLRARGIDLLMPQHQYLEGSKVAVSKAGWSSERFHRFAATIVEVLPVDDYAGMEETARARLQPRGQPDWPVLAAAIEYEDAIWSNDRDFFGVGVPVWTTDNVKFAGRGP